MRAMAYAVHFLALAPGAHWVDALEALEQVDHKDDPRTKDAAVDIVRADWWRIASSMRRILPRIELRRTRQGLTCVDPSSGLVLDLEVREILLSLPYRSDEGRARDTLALAQRIAQVIEDETGLQAFDAQLEEPFLGVDGGLERGVQLICATQRALARVPRVPSSAELDGTGAACSR